MIRSLLVIACLCVATPLHAAIASFQWNLFRNSTTAEVQNDPVLAGKSISEFFVYTDADIQSIEDVRVRTSPLYQHPFGSDTEPPLPAFVGLFPALGADSWISTPGTTSTIGGFSADNSVWFDLTDEGPVTNFMFARLTFGQFFYFAGTLKLVGQNQQIESFPFYFVFPEPGSAALAVPVAVGFVAVRRRFGQCPTRIG